MPRIPLLRTTLSSLACLVLLASAPGGARAGSAPWRIDDLLPKRLSLSFQTRVRYEYLFNQFRAGTTGNDDILVLRTLVHGRVRAADWLTVGAEMIDARAYLQQIPVSTGIVNTFDLLQGYAELTASWPFGGSSTLRGGRLTMDVGSRRLVARNRFRNTINAFTGLDWQWQGEGQRRARAFWTLPIQRLPFLPDETADNEPGFDEESLDVQFWGFFYADALPGGHRGEVFAFGLYEKDSEDRPTRNRRLGTPGVRLWKPPATRRLDYMLESVIQFGQSRATAASRRDLDHFAHFHHLEVGWSFDAPWSPRLLAQFDYASGDRDPDDGRNGQFTTLFGARRFDFNPTGIYGPFFRANLVTPGLRLRLRPAENVTSFVSVRAFWLAERRDAWVGSGLRDPTGRSGSYLGTQIEMRVRWDLFPGNLRLEAGWAHLFAGGFRDDAPRSNGQGDVTYLYTQATLRF